VNAVKGQIKFTGKDQQEFFEVLRSRVEDYFTTNGITRYANGKMIIKSIVFLSLYLIPYFVLMLMQIPVGIQLGLWIVMGIALAGIGMSVMHDANHGAYSSRKWVNRLMGHTLNLAGGSVFNWKNQHNILHHTYTNIASFDEDIDDKLILRMSPHTRVKGIHRFQVIYAFLFYGILTLYWALAKDFIQFHKHTKNGVNPQSRQHNRNTLAKIIITKIFYFGYTVVIPIAVFKVSWTLWIGGYLLMHFTAGMILTTIFQLAHTVEGTDHPVPSASGTLENSWAVHQLRTTVNFSTTNPLITYYVGGLNFQVEHHLFPRVCHIHYPAIAPIVAATAREYGIPYMENPRFMDALRSHIRTLQRFGKATLELG
jgi:linoleoyl-CoA desaturase